MNALSQLFKRFSQFKYSLSIILLAAFILHLAPSLSGHFYADDYLQRSLVVGSDALAEKGLMAGIDVGSLSYFLSHQFSFFSASFDNYSAMIDTGMLPWWSNDSAFMNFSRPLSALSHFIDYSLFPDNAHLMQLISLMWYVLGLLIIYRLYLIVGLSKHLALFSLLLLTLDLTIFSGLAWIAARNILLVTVFGFFTVYAYHRGVSSKLWYGLALLALLASLLSAEAAIGICAYLGAYTLAFDSRKLKQKLLYILPFIGVTLLWRLVYQQAGFGVSGIDLYVDPGQSPVLFFTRAVWAYPANYFELVTGIDVMSGQVRGDIRQNFAWAGIGVFVIISYLLRDVLRQDKVLRFFYLASLLALIPSVTVTISSRTLFLPFVSMAVVFSYLIQLWLKPVKEKYLEGRNIATRLWRYVLGFVCVYVLLVHGVLSLFATGASLYSGLTTPAQSVEEARSIKGLPLADLANKTVVIVNSPEPYLLAYLDYEMDYKQFELPASIRALASAYSNMQLRRVSETELSLVADKIFQLDASALQRSALSPLPSAHALYMSHELLGLNRSKTTQWHTGLQRSFDDMIIRVDALSEGKPSQLTIQLKQPLNQYIWFEWDVENKKYRQITLPDIGQALNFKRVF